MSKDVECPYCGEWQEVCHDDGQGYAEDELHQQDCADCDKTFVFTTYISYSYESSKADCLNGGDHAYRKTMTAPRWATRMRCEDCDTTRQLTAEERAALGPEYAVPEWVK